MMPVPVPMSATLRPVRLRRSTKPDRNSLAMKKRGWNTVGRTVRRNPPARTTLVRRRLRMKLYDAK
jgi:hypothetical protein